MNKKPNLIRDKSFDFAVKIINLYKKLCGNKNEYVLSKQIMRAGTSVGANVREAVNAESKKDFIHKLAISQKECDECIYWLDLLHETKYIYKIEYTSLVNDATEILKIIRSIILTTKQRMGK